MLKLAVAEADGFPLSDTCAVKFDVPTPFGFPEISPLVAFKVRPLGKLPCVIDHVYAGNPPVAAKVVL